MEIYTRTFESLLLEHFGTLVKRSIMDKCKITSLGFLWSLVCSNSNLQPTITFNNKLVSTTIGGRVSIWLPHYHYFFFHRNNHVSLHTHFWYVWIFIGLEECCKRVLYLGEEEGGEEDIKEEGNQCNLWGKGFNCLKKRRKSLL